MARDPVPAAGRRPLYLGRGEARLITTAVGNAGLWYDKFCDRWNAGWDGLGDSGKRDWIATIANLDGTAAKRVGDRELLAEAAARQRDLTKKLDGCSFPLATAWRFVSGLGRSHPVENGFAWHHGLGAPYLPGSSVKGVARAWARWAEFGDIDRIFGPRSGDAAAGSVIFLDALPVAPVVLDADVMTPHYGPWYQPDALKKEEVPGDWHSPTPIPFLTVAPGQTFQFALLPRTPADKADCETAAARLLKALETLGAGAKTAIGYGQFGPLSDAEAVGGKAAGVSLAPPATGKAPARLPSGRLVQARLVDKNKKDKWRALHEESGVVATVEGNAPDGCESGKMFEFLCTSGTNLKWPTDQDRQRLSTPARKPGGKPAGKGKGKGRR